MATNPEPLDPPDPSFSISFDCVPIPDDDVDFPLPNDLMDFDFDQLLDFSMEDLLSLPSPDQFDLPPGSEGFLDHSNSNDGSGVSCLFDASGDPISDADAAMMSCLDRGCSESVPGAWCSDVARVLNSPSPASSGSPDRSSSGSRSCNPISDVARVPNPSEFSGSPDREVSVDRSSDVARFLKSPSPESSASPDHCSSGSALCDRSREVAKVSNSQDLHREVSRSSSGDGSHDSGSHSQGFSGSGAQCSDAFRVLNSPSPDSGSSSLDSSNVQSATVASEQRIKLEDGSKGQLSKRKKGNEDGIADSRTSKFCRSVSSGNVHSPGSLRAGNDEEDKKQVRLMRNRESAQLSRQRKKHYVEELEDKVKSMHSTIAELNGKISFFMAENASLRQQLGATGMYPPPAMAPMHFPWVPCASYALKPQGSQVPLIPIPRLKPQQPVSATKSKKSTSKKAEPKTKKVASVSFIGLLFFLLIIGGLVPFLGTRLAGRTQVPARLNFVNGGLDGGKSRGRVLAVSGHLNGSAQRGFGLYTEKEGYRKGGVEGMVEESDGIRNKLGSKSLPGVDGFEFSGNASEPLVASLYVPRNNKLVKIDGNLIIHSVLASEKAVESSRASSGMKSAKPTVSSDKEVGKNGLAIAGNLASALAVSHLGPDLTRHSHVYRSPTERPKALTSGAGDAYRDNPKSVASDGPLQQWFREGLAGPVLSSGMCTEVLQFEISPTSAANPGAIIPATSVVNASTEQHPESGRSSKLKNRRILYHPPIPLAGSTHNRTGEYGAESPKDGSFHGNKSVSSSMVVSVLIDPKEAGDGDSDQMIAPKSLSRIFVVVLLDSVKYVTYSCVLPLKGSGTHVVAA